MFLNPARATAVLWRERWPRCPGDSNKKNARAFLWNWYVTGDSDWSSQQRQRGWTSTASNLVSASFVRDLACSKVTTNPSNAIPFLFATRWGVLASSSFLARKCLYGILYLSSYIAHTQKQHPTGKRNLSVWFSFWEKKGRSSFDCCLIINLKKKKNTWRLFL